MTTTTDDDRVNIEQSASGRLEGRVLQQQSSYDWVYLRLKSSLLAPTVAPYDNSISNPIPTVFTFNLLKLLRSYFLLKQIASSCIGCLTVSIINFINSDLVSRDWKNNPCSCIEEVLILWTLGCCGLAYLKLYLHQKVWHENPAVLADTVSFNFVNTTSL